MCLIKLLWCNRNCHLADGGLAAVFREREAASSHSLCQGVFIHLLNLTEQIATSVFYGVFFLCCSLALMSPAASSERVRETWRDGARDIEGERDGMSC